MPHTHPFQAPTISQCSCYDLAEAQLRNYASRAGAAHFKVLDGHRAPEAAGRQTLRLLRLVQLHHLALQASPATGEHVAYMHKRGRSDYVSLGGGAL